MPSKYHINRAGNVTACRATTQPCPLGGQHYASAALAQEVLDLHEEARAQMQAREHRRRIWNERAEQLAVQYREEAEQTNPRPNNDPNNAWLIQNPAIEHPDYITVNLTHISSLGTIDNMNSNHLERTAYLTREQDLFAKNPQPCDRCGTNDADVTPRWDPYAMDVGDKYEISTLCDDCELELAREI